jgi:hypothetical protein
VTHRSSEVENVHIQQTASCVTENTHQDKDTEICCDWKRAMTTKMNEIQMYNNILISKFKLFHNCVVHSGLYTSHNGTSELKEGRTGHHTDLSDL